MLKYTIKTDRVCEIPGIGRLVPDVDHEISEDQARMFEAVFGRSLGKATFPSGTEVTVHLLPDEPEEAPEAPEEGN